MDETTNTLTGILETQRAVNTRLSPEAKVSFAMGHALGQLALKELIENLEADRAKWHHEATHDKLTGALNREGLEEYLEMAKAPKAALLVDATNFKAVNDMPGGYSTGDRLIVDTYKLLNESVRPVDKICRWGGDEFVIILNGEDEPATHPDGPMAYERRTQRPSHAEHIAEVKERIADEVNEFLAGRPELQAINFDLAVGGRKWEQGLKAEELVDLLKQDMEQHKALQHKMGQYREP